MKKLIPYILAYLIVATCTAVYPYIYRHVFMTSITEMMPHGSVAVVLNPGMSHDEFVAKLQQVGLSEAHGQKYPIVRPAPVLTAVFHFAYHYAFDAVVFAAFAGFVILFQRKFQAKAPDHDHAV